MITDISDLHENMQKIGDSVKEIWKIMTYAELQERVTTYNDTGLSNFANVRNFRRASNSDRTS